ncbi:hypothetical protein MBH78_20110 [Oceanimonas sp. NS1]|nr:hypothetical protein [Oceanimonas sp. NS1]
MSKRICSVVALMLFSLSVQAEDISLQLSGLDGELEDNTQIYLDQLPAIEVEQLPRFRKQIISAVTDSLQALGYYNPQIEVTQDEDDSTEVRVQVTPGEPVRIRTLDLTLSGDATADPAFTELQTNFGIREGEVLHHDDYERPRPACSAWRCGGAISTPVTTRVRCGCTPGKRPPTLS